jgi:NAD(P)H-flavin reductase/ferredoxin
MFAWLNRSAVRTHTAHFNAQGVSIEVAPDQTLLQAALAAGLPYPHQCRVGSCKTCLCRLVAGKVRQLTDTSYILDPGERRSGAILACQTRLLEDIRVDIQWPAPAPGNTAIDATVERVLSLTDDIVELTLKLDAPLTYTAGQYAQVSVPALGIARSYSFACAPESSPQTVLCFYVRLVPQGTFSGWLPTATGERVQVRGPMGSFILAPSSSPLLFVAGSSGLAPVKAMLEQALREGCGRDATFLFAARTSRDLYALPEIEAIVAGWAGRFEFVPVLSREPTGSDWTGARGRVTQDLATRVSNLARHHAYLCGPPPMVDAATAALRACGVVAESIRADRFAVNGEDRAP